MPKIPDTVADPGRVDALAQQIRDGVLSPVDLVQHCIDRIDAVEPQVEAWRELCTDTAFAEAKNLEQEIETGLIRGPLHGIPVGLKDLFNTAGVRTTSGSRIFDTFIPDEDCTAAARFRPAGAVLAGKLQCLLRFFRSKNPTALTRQAV